MSLFADDVASILDMTDPSVLRTFLGILEKFARSTGLSINYNKTTVYRLSSLRRSKAVFYSEFGLFWTNDPFKFLGVVIGGGSDDLIKLNYSPIFERAQIICDMWKSRDISLLGKVCVVNSLIASLFVYKMSVLPDIPEYLIKDFDQMIRKFIWNGAHPKSNIPHFN